ncbi:Autotransporter-associated beta strand repeat protein, partial [Diplonema papillatum]
MAKMMSSVRMSLLTMGVVLLVVAVVLTAVFVTLQNKDDDDFIFPLITLPPSTAAPTSYTNILNPVGSELVVPEPEVAFPLPVANYVANNSPQQARVSTHRLAKALGELRFTMDSNPIVRILRGFNSIWILGDKDWASGAADGDGPDDFSQAEIVNPAIWASNMAYTEKICRERTPAQATFAYLDDTRSQNFAVLDGLGPFYEDYIAATGAFSTVRVSEHDAVDDDRKMDVKDGGNGAGDPSSVLGKVVDIVSLMRNSHASTTGSKYYYMSPRPWRMTSLGHVVNLGHETLTCHDENGSSHNLSFDLYHSNISVIPALICARRQSKTYENGTFMSSSRGKDGGYPSGHTNAGYLAAIGLAYAVPERFAEMWTRASELGESRILSGLHSPLDVIGGRVHATAISAAALLRSDNAALKKQAVEQANAFFSSKLPIGQTLFAKAHSNDTSRWSNHVANKALFRWRLTYGLPRNSQMGQPPIVPFGAEVLLESRLPYLTAEQRRAVLFTTAIDSGFSVLDESNGWGRLDLVTASDGYASLQGDVAVYMDASKGGFHSHDTWRNDISGSGLLTKNGSGALTLSGHNTYSGGTYIVAGTLEAVAHSSLGEGSLLVGESAELKVSTHNLFIRGKTVLVGSLRLVLSLVSPQIVFQDSLHIDGASLVLDFSKVGIVGTTPVVLLEAATISGSFDAWSSSGTSQQVLITYSECCILLTANTSSATHPPPTVSFPLPVSTHIANNSISAFRYNAATNPLPYILKGMDNIWSLGDAEWANGGANGEGPLDFSQTQILNASVWEYNMAYTLKVCEERTVAEAVSAYLDDTQSHNHAVLDGLGPLREAFVTETEAFTTVTITETSVLDAGRLDQTDEGNGAGNPASSLGKVIDMV